MTLREALWVLLGFIGLTALYWWPMVMEPDRVWATGRDFFQNTWNLWWVDHAFEHGKEFYATDRLFSPNGTSLAFHTISFTNSIPGLLLQRGFGLSLGTTHSVLLLSAFLMSGLGFWALVRYLTHAPLASFAAGVFFTFNPYHTMMVTQLNNAQFQWMPLTLLGLMLIFDRKKWWTVGFTGVMLALSGYTDWYQPIFVALAAGVLLLVRMKQDARLSDGRLWLMLIVAGLLGGLLMLPGALPLVEVMGEEGHGGGDLENPIRYLGETQLLGMSPNGVGTHMFWPVVFGWVTCLMVLYTMMFVRTRGVGMFWWLSIFGFLLLQGPYLVVLNRHLEGIPMPMALFSHLPVLDMIRVPHRFLILVLLGLGGLLAYGLRELQIQRGKTFVVLVTALLAYELLPPAPTPVQMSRAPIYDRMAADSEDYSVLELPIDYRDGYTMWLQTGHGKRLLAGYTSHILPSALPALQTDLMRALHPSESDTDVLGLPEFLPLDLDSLTPEQLEAWRHELRVEKGVRYIILHDRGDFSTAAFDFKPPSTTAEKLGISLMPYRFNPGVAAVPSLQRIRANQFWEGLTEHSQQAIALVELLFGDSDPALGSATTRVWDLR